MSCTRKRRIPYTLLVLSLLWAAVSCAPERADDAQTAVLATQTERFRAIVNADFEALESILAPDLVYTHSHGGVESKTEFLANLRSGRVDYLEMTPTRNQVRVYGDTAVLTGDISLRVAAGGQEHQVTMRYTEIYVRSDARWQLAAWQSTQFE